MSLVLDEFYPGQIIADHPDFDESLLDEENEDALRLWLKNHLLNGIKTVAADSERMYKSDYETEILAKYNEKLKTLKKPKVVYIDATNKEVDKSSATHMRVMIDGKMFISKI